jgi:hypothetical protein
MVKTFPTPTSTLIRSERFPRSKSQSTRLGKSQNPLIGLDTDTPFCASTSVVSGALLVSWTPCRIRPALILQKSSNGLLINPGRPAKSAFWESRKPDSSNQPVASSDDCLPLLPLDTTAEVNGESQRASPKDLRVSSPGRVRRPPRRLALALSS